MATVSVSEAPAVRGPSYVLPVVGTVGMVLEWFDLSAVAAVVAVIWLALWAINGYRLSRFRCPRCEEYFFMRRI